MSSLNRACEELNNMNSETTFDTKKNNLLLFYNTFEMLLTLLKIQLDIGVKDMNVLKTNFLNFLKIWNSATPILEISKNEFMIFLIINYYRIQKLLISTFLTLKKQDLNYNNNLTPSENLDAETLANKLESEIDWHLNKNTNTQFEVSPLNESMQFNEEFSNEKLLEQMQILFSSNKKNQLGFNGDLMKEALFYRRFLLSGINQIKLNLPDHKISQCGFAEKFDIDNITSENFFIFKADELKTLIELSRNIDTKISNILKDDELEQENKKDSLYNINIFLNWDETAEFRKYCHIEEESETYNIQRYLNNLNISNQLIKICQINKINTLDKFLIVEIIRKIFQISRTKNFDTVYNYCKLVESIDNNIDFQRGEIISTISLSLKNLVLSDKFFVNPEKFDYLFKILANHEVTNFKFAYVIESKKIEILELLKKQKKNKYINLIWENILVTYLDSIKNEVLYERKLEEGEILISNFQNIIEYFSDVDIEINRILNILREIYK